MAELKVEVDPSEVGFDPERLARIDAHFRPYVDDGLLPGWLVVVSRRGQIAHLSTYGMRDVEAAAPVEVDTLWRIYSMTKPVTSVAAMMLYEEGAFELKDPVSQFIPSFADTKVYRSGPATNPVLEPLTEPMRIWHLLTQTSGLTYGFHYTTPVDAMYRAVLESGEPVGDLATLCDRIASLPLLFQPGAAWNYGVSTDVLGRVIEVASGQTLDEFLRERIFEPLGMTDTDFYARDVDRLAALYTPSSGSGTFVRADEMGDLAKTPPECPFGGGGLVSTASDYHRFSQMLLRGGALDGVRLLGPRTVRYMAQNHLPGGQDLESFGRGGFAETAFDGVGFGLGFSVVQDNVAAKVLSAVGEYGWGGAASTVFWVDPAEEITGLFMTQLMPSSTYAIRPRLKRLVNQALVD